jgi:hypothetical protein
VVKPSITGTEREAGGAVDHATVYDVLLTITAGGLRGLLRSRAEPVDDLTVRVDVPGPPFGVYLAGARLLEVFPVLPLAANVSLGLGAMSYAGPFNIMAIADQDAYPDFDVFAASAERRAAGSGCIRVARAGPVVHGGSWLPLTRAAARVTLASRRMAAAARGELAR